MLKHGKTSALCLRLQFLHYCGNCRTEITRWFVGFFFTQTTSQRFFLKDFF